MIDNALAVYSSGVEKCYDNLGLEIMERAECDHEARYLLLCTSASIRASIFVD